MPRGPRTIVAGSFVHLISRFVDGRFVFDDEARVEYLARLGRAISLTDWVLISFALMSSHLHLGAIAGTVPLSDWLQPVHVSMAQWLNRRSRKASPNTRGHVFADRPRTKCYELSLAGFVITYHHRNPVSAGVVVDPADSTWTSHRAYVGLDQQPSFLDVRRGLVLSGCSPDAAGRAEFARLVRARANLDLAELDALDDEPQGDVPPVQPATLVTTLPRPASVVRAAAALSGVTVAEVYGRTRAKSVTKARRLAALAWLTLGGRGTEMARELGVSPGAITRMRQRSRGIQQDLVAAVATRSLQF